MEQLTNCILSVNVGSSSIKFSLFPIVLNKLGEPLIKGEFANLIVNQKSSCTWIYQNQKNFFKFAVPLDKDKFNFALDLLVKLLHEKLPLAFVMAVSHRVVHGGKKFIKPVVVNKSILLELDKLSPLAPLHQPHNVNGINVFKKFFPRAIQVACFDTAFHKTIPDVEKYYAIPNELSRQGLIRYGFHGLSYQYIIHKLKDVSPKATGKVVMMHLGNGASMCASYNCQSIATTMGFSTIEGLMMGTRSGSIDPGILFYLINKGWNSTDLENLLYKKSGLQGVSGISSNMQILRSSDKNEAIFAIEMFCYQIIKNIFSMVGVMNGIDVLVFSGGIGEHDHQLRHDVLKKITYLGVEIDDTSNKKEKINRPICISKKSSKVEVWIIPTDEGRVAAEEALNLIQ